jgi:heme/copper-type cytochrome/quinol oxidase subunit 3
MKIPYTIEPRPDTGINNVRLGVWLFLASEVMLFGGLFSAYFTLRAGSTTPWTPLRQHIPPAALNTGLLLGGSAAFLAARHAIRGGREGAYRAWMFGATLLPALFLPHKLMEYQHHWREGVSAATSAQWAMYFLLTGIHALHVAGGVAVNVWLASSTRDVPRLVNRLSATALYWYFVDLVWLVLVAIIYVW